MKRDFSNPKFTTYAMIGAFSAGFLIGAILL